jgi:hypothetical protein
MIIAHTLIDAVAFIGYALLVGHVSWLVLPAGDALLPAGGRSATRGGRPPCTSRHGRASPPHIPPTGRRRQNRGAPRAVAGVKALWLLWQALHSPQRLAAEVSPAELRDFPVR